jgi:decaprenylphospho-beta-D-erythro-pentofuranosid-2-ulose 2-reductase
MGNELQDRKSVAVLGATSAIARATAHAFARDGYAVVLGAHDAAENELVAADIRTRFDVVAHALPFDAGDFGSHDAFLDGCEEALGGLPTGFVLCFGYMAEQADCQQDFELLRKTIDINVTGTASILEKIAGRFEARKSGFITVLSSVAGDRGRQSNYIYGAAKAGLSAYLQGLRNRLYKSNVQVTTVKPGFVDTKMTYGLPLPGPLVASPEAAGQAIYRATVKGKNEVYVPFFWRHIMLIIKYIPEWQFKKMGL